MDSGRERAFCYLRALPGDLAPHAHGADETPVRVDLAVLPARRVAQVHRAAYPPHRAAKSTNLVGSTRCLRTASVDGDHTYERRDRKVAPVDYTNCGGWASPGTTMRSRTSVAVVLACLLALVGHLLTGHAHADLLTDAPITIHEPGDEHHERASACDSVQAVQVGEPLVPASGLVVAVPSVPHVSLPRAFDPGPRVFPTRPLFLLHAALLI